MSFNIKRHIYTSVISWWMWVIWCWFFTTRLWVTNAAAQRISGELLLFNLSRPRGPHQKFDLNTQNNRWCKMTQSHLGQLNKFILIEVHTKFRQIICERQDFLVFRVYLAFKHTFSIPPLPKFLAWSFKGTLRPFAFSYFLFCHPFGGHHSLKKAIIPEENVLIALFSAEVRPTCSEITENLPPSTNHYVPSPPQALCKHIPRALSWTHLPSR